MFFEGIVRGLTVFPCSVSSLKCRLQCMSETMHDVESGWEGKVEECLLKAL